MSGILKHQDITPPSLSGWQQCPPWGVSEIASVNAIVETSMAASTPVLFARSLVESTLDGSDEMSAVKMSISSEVERLEQPEGTDAITVCAVKLIPMATMGCTRDSMHWHTYPGAGHRGPASARH